MMFEPVSLEFLSTPVTEPQVKVTIKTAVPKVNEIQAEKNNLEGERFY